MRYRKLRIAWSVLWGLAAVLLILLWVRSYVRHGDLASLVDTSVSSMKGRIVFFTFPDRDGPWELEDFPSYAAATNTAPRIPVAFGSTPAGRYVTTSYWFLVPLSTAFATVPWLPYRFSLRTLLIATTLVAVVLGLAMYAIRH